MHENMSGKYYNKSNDKLLLLLARTQWGFSESILHYKLVKDPNWSLEAGQLAFYSTSIGKDMKLGIIV